MSLAGFGSTFPAHTLSLSHWFFHSHSKSHLSSQPQAINSITHAFTHSQSLHLSFFSLRLAHSLTFPSLLHADTTLLSLSLSLSLSLCHLYFLSSISDSCTPVHTHTFPLSLTLSRQGPLQWSIVLIQTQRCINFPSYKMSDAQWQVIRLIQFKVIQSVKKLLAKKWLTFRNDVFLMLQL